MFNVERSMFDVRFLFLESRFAWNDEWRDGRDLGTVSTYLLTCCAI